MDALEEACEVVVSLLRRPRTSFAGRYYRRDPATYRHKLQVLRDHRNLPVVQVLRRLEALTRSFS